MEAIEFPLYKLMIILTQMGELSWKKTCILAELSLDRKYETVYTRNG